MDEEMIRRCQITLPPFDGVVVTTDGLFIPLPRLRSALIAVCRCVQHYYPVAGLLTLHDWHAHDGHITIPQPTSWLEVWTTLASEDRLYASRTGVWNVSIALFPEDRSFYWRYHVLNENQWPIDYPGRWGDFDVTSAEPLASKIMQVVHESGVAQVFQGSAKPYFDRIVT